MLHYLRFAAGSSFLLSGHAMLRWVRVCGAIQQGYDMICHRKHMLHCCSTTHTLLGAGITAQHLQEGDRSSRVSCSAVLRFQNEMQSRCSRWRQQSQKAAKSRLIGVDAAEDSVTCSSCIKEHGHSPALRNDVTSSAACSLASAATSSAATPSQRSCRSARVAGAASLYRRASSSSSHL